MTGPSGESVVSDLSHASNETRDNIPDVGRPGRKRWQVGLRTLFLLMAAIAVWMAYFINRRHNAALAARIEALVPLAHELIVDDPSKVAVVKLDNLWMSEDRWEIYLPDGRFRLCLATRGIGDAGLAGVMESTLLPPGRHQLALEQRRIKDVWRVAILRDGTESIAKQEPAVWDNGSSSTNGEDYSISLQLAPDEPAILLRRRFMRDDGKGSMATTVEPGDGILLWIERSAESNTKP
jgi:hypothetical protein